MRSVATLEGIGNKSDNTTSYREQTAPSVNFSVKSSNKYKCTHDSFDRLVGDAHLTNCNECGAFYPKSGSVCIRHLKRHTNQNNLYTSDILRSMYSQCQAKGMKPENQLKVSRSYQEVRNLIIDWLAEVSETLHLDIQKSAYHAIFLLDRFLSNNLKYFQKEMD